MSLETICVAFYGLLLVVGAYNTWKLRRKSK